MSALDNIRARATALFQASVARLAALVSVDVSELAVELKKELRVLLPDLLLAAEASGSELEDRREIVLAEVGRWYDEHVLPQNLPGPDFIVDPAVRSAVLAAASELVDFGHLLIEGYEALKNKPAA